MKRFLTIFFLIAVFVNSAFNRHLTAATHLQHDWRQYFSYESGWLFSPTLNIVKMVVPPTGGIYVLESLNSSYILCNSMIPVA